MAQAISPPLWNLMWGGGGAGGAYGNSFVPRETKVNVSFMDLLLKMLKERFRQLLVCTYHGKTSKQRS